MVDVFHHNLSENPIEAIADIYGHFDMPFSGAARKRMQIWPRDNPRHRFGGHSYSPGDFGLTTERERFDFYHSRVAVEKGDAS